MMSQVEVRAGKARMKTTKLVLCAFVATSLLPSATRADVVGVRLCPDPIHVGIRIGAVAFPSRRLAFDVCGAESERVQGSDVADEIPWDGEGPPHGTFVVRDGKLDVTLDDVAGGHHGVGIPIGARDVSLPGSPPARISVTRARGPHVMLRVEDVVAREVAREIARLAEIRVGGIEQLGDEEISLGFGMLDVRSALAISSMASGVVLLARGEGHYAYSTRAEARELERLQKAIDDATGNEAARERALEAKRKFVMAPREGPLFLEDDHWVQLALLAEGRRDMARAVAVHRERVAHVEAAAGGPVGADYAFALGELALALEREAQDSSEAEALLRRAVPLAEREVGPVDARLRSKQVALGARYLAAARYDDAEPLLVHALEGYATDRDAASGHVFALGRYAALLEARGRAADAVTALERALAISREAFGDTDYFTNIARFELADLAWRHDEPAKSAELMKAIATGDAPEQFVERSKRRLAALAALGAYVGDARVDATALDALRTALAGAPDEEILMEMEYLLERRAARRFGAARDDPGVRESCVAYVEVERSIHDVSADDAARLALVERCVRRAGENGRDG